MNNLKSLPKVKLFTVLSASAFMIMAVSTSNAANFTGVDATPSIYQVTLKKFEFVRNDGTAYTFVEGSFTFDIASGTAGSAIGSLAAGNKLDPGTYTEIRLTLERVFGLLASVPDANSGQPCRTESGNPATETLDNGDITGVGIGTADAQPATLQQVPIPTGAAVTEVLEEIGISELSPGGDITLTLQKDINIPSTATVAPTIAIEFDVIDAAELLTTAAGRCVVFPQPPGITITVGN